MAKEKVPLTNLRAAHFVVHSLLFTCVLSLIISWYVKDLVYCLYSGGAFISVSLVLFFIALSHEHIVHLSWFSFLLLVISYGFVFESRAENDSHLLFVTDYLLRGAIPMIIFCRVVIPFALMWPNEPLSALTPYDMDEMKKEEDEQEKEE